MGDDSTTAHTAARGMIDTFRSVGATRFDVTLTTASGEKDTFRRGVSLSELVHTLPGILDAAAATQRNVIVRPYSPNIVFVQLDDLKAAQLTPLAPAVFLTLETSPGNFQAWAAIRGLDDKDFARRLRKGTGADATASGATRVAGSLNFKDKYAPDFPRVRIATAQAGRTTTTAELEQLGLVAPREETAPSAVASAPHKVPRSNRTWPSYELCLDRAPPSQGSPGQTRQSIADFTWCMIAADWGFSVGEIATRLMEESAKARDNGPTYALKTATRAAEAAARNDAERRNRQRQHRHG